MAAGRRFVTFSCSCKRGRGQNDPVDVAFRGFQRTLDGHLRAAIVAGFKCAEHMTGFDAQPEMTGVFDASDKAKASPTDFTIEGRFGRGSSNQIWLFIANAWLRSCMMEEPSP